jgi:predicted esterase
MPKEHHIQVQRTARYYTIGEPGPATRDVWFVCHGYGQPAADFIREFEIIANRTRVIVAPEALSRHYLPTEPGYHSGEARVGASWMTREDRQMEIADYVGYLDALYDEITTKVNRQNVSVTVLGFSQGGATADRWVSRGRSRVHRLVLWGAFLASDADLNQAATIFGDVKLTIVYGTKDKYTNEQLVEDYQTLLKEKTIPFELITFDGGHRMDRGTLKSLARNS